MLFLQRPTFRLAVFFPVFCRAQNNEARRGWGGRGADRKESARRLSDKTQARTEGPEDSLATTGQDDEESAADGVVVTSAVSCTESIKAIEPDGADNQSEAQPVIGGKSNNEERVSCAAVSETADVQAKPGRLTYSKKAIKAAKAKKKADCLSMSLGEEQEGKTPAGSAPAEQRKSCNDHDAFSDEDLHEPVTKAELTIAEALRRYDKNFEPTKPPRSVLSSESVLSELSDSEDETVLTGTGCIAQFQWYSFVSVTI